MLGLVLVSAACGQSPITQVSPRVPGFGSRAPTLEILADDFVPQPYQGDEIYFYNRLEGDRGSLNDSHMAWGEGQVKATIAEGMTWGGGWMSLNHPAREGLGVDFSGLLPAQIKPEYQSQITGIQVVITQGTPGRIFRLELKDGAALRWKKEITLQGGEQVLEARLPGLENITQLVWVLDRAAPGDFVTLKKIAFEATTQVSDTATRAFVWSYGMLLSNWNLATGLVRDKAKDASGEMDAIQSTGALAAVTALAEQLGVIERADALGIVGTISEALLNRLPRYHGLWPHWVKVSPAGEFSLLEGTEWSSVDTVIAALGLLEAQQALGMDTTGTEQMLQAMDWEALVTANGISHGYTSGGELIPYAWDTFGGESWLVEMVYASATGRALPVAYSSPPTANGSGFIDELAWLFLPPPSGKDIWDVDWQAYRQEAAEKQITYYLINFPTSCFQQASLFGLSAAEVPDPSQVAKEAIYQAFGVGGRFAPALDTAGSKDALVVIPHYSAMIASLRPKEALQMWDWLIQVGHFSPLTNVESLAFPDASSCNSGGMVWNQLKGSWNLSLQALGWGRYLAEKGGETPVLWQAARTNNLLQKGYALLATPGAELAFLPTLIPTPEIAPTEPVVEPVQAPTAAIAGEEWALKITSGPELQVPRSAHTATLLLDGRVLLVGGSGAVDQQLTSAEIYDPASGSTVLAASLHTARHGHTATLLPDGRVLVVGGYKHLQQWLADAEVYDPRADTWTVIPPLYPHGIYHTVTLLQDGRVLVVGGTVASGYGSGSERAEIFDPRYNTWTEVRPLISQRSSHMAVLLQDGRVLVAGGGGPEGPPVDGDAVIYDPVTNNWTATGPMVKPRIFGKSVRLSDGRVLVAGGRAMDYDPLQDVLSSAEIYDPVTNTWAATAPLAQPRYGFVLTLLVDGKVLAAGGTSEYDHFSAGSFIYDTEIYDPESGYWTSIGILEKPRVYATATLLADGRVFLAGGETDQVFYADSLLVDIAYSVSTQFATTWQYQRECEFPDEATVGQALPRSNASGLTVHGQFGSAATSPWAAIGGYVRYRNITIPGEMDLTLKLRYSKYSASTVPISIYLDDETTPRATFYPSDQGSWNNFAWAGEISLGRVAKGVHSIIFVTDGQQYGVADLDKFELDGKPVQEATTPMTEAPAPVVLPEKIYFTVGKTFYQMDLDGSDLERIAQEVPIVNHIIVDYTHQKLFLTRWEASGQILVYDLSKGGTVRVFSNGPVDGGAGLAIDPAGTYMYLGIYYSGVFKMDLTNPGNWRQLVSSDALSPLHGQRGQLQLDPVNEQLYFKTAYNFDCDLCRTIYRVDLDGSNLAKILPFNGGDALALDLTARKLYFSDVVDDHSGRGSFTIYRANLDGTGLETVLQIPPPFRCAITFYLDEKEKKIYLQSIDPDSENKGWAIARVNMDGSGYEVLHQVYGGTEDEVFGAMAVYLP